MPKPKPTRKPPAKPPARKPEPPPAPLKLEWLDPKLLAGNPKNWRRHPESQLAALAETLAQIGWAGACLFNRRTNRLVDGHARVEAAIKKNIPAVPVLVGDWAEQDEAKILLTLDPLGSMATADPESLRLLMLEADLHGEAFTGLLDNLALLAELNPPAAEAETAASSSAGDFSDQFMILVKCKTEMQQTELLDRFDREGLDCKALVS